MTRHLVRWVPTGEEVWVPGDKPLLFGLLDAGLPLAFTCMQGHCRTCRARLVDGAVEHHTTPGLTEQEREMHQLLLCVAYPVSPHLTLAVSPA
jgi:ferredoxin